MVIIKKNNINPEPGKPFKIVASGGVGLYMFTLRMNGKVKTIVQKDPELNIHIPEDTAGEVSIKVMDNKKAVDTCKFDVKRLL